MVAVEEEEEDGVDAADEDEDEEEEEEEEGVEPDAAAAFFCLRFRAAALNSSSLLAAELASSSGTVTAFGGSAPLTRSRPDPLRPALPAEVKPSASTSACRELEELDGLSSCEVEVRCWLELRLTAGDERTAGEAEPEPEPELAPAPEPLSDTDVPECARGGRPPFAPALSGCKFAEDLALASAEAAPMATAVAQLWPGSRDGEGRRTPKLGFGSAGLVAATEEAEEVEAEVEAVEAEVDVEAGLGGLAG